NALAAPSPSPRYAGERAGVRGRPAARTALGTRSHPHPDPLLFEPEPQSRRPAYRERGPEATTETMRPFVGFALLVALVALVAGGKAILHDTLDPDCFWHLRVAEQLHRDGIGPLVDNLSFASSKRPWTP